MRYNAPDTIYYQQARSIQELAKKNFENLRQESDNEPLTKAVVRRGRPPSKNIKQHVGQPPAELSALDFSLDPKISNAGGGANLSKPNHALSNKGSATEKLGSTEVSARASYAFRNTELFGCISMNRVYASEEYSGSAKGISTKFRKKTQVVDENRRNTYRQLQQYTCGYKLPILSLIDGEKNLLAAVGLHMEYAYARSLAQFAAHIGPVGWAIAAKKIKNALPPETKFGRGWVRDNEVPQISQPPIHSTSPSYQSSQTMISSCTNIPKGNNKPSAKLDPSYSDMSSEGIGKTTLLVYAPASGVGSSRFRSNLPSRAGNMLKAIGPPMLFRSELPMTHANALEIVSRNNSNSKNNSNPLFIQTHSSHLDAEKIKFAHSCNSPAQLRSSSMEAKLESIPPDLNVGFQSSSAVVDSQQPDLALQL